MKNTLIVIAITTILVATVGLYISNLAKKQNEGADLDTINTNLNKQN